MPPVQMVNRTLSRPLHAERPLVAPVGIGGCRGERSAIHRLSASVSGAIPSLGSQVLPRGPQAVAGRG